MSNHGIDLKQVSVKQQREGRVFVFSAIVLIAVLGFHAFKNVSLEHLVPAQVFHYQLDMSFEPQGKEVVVGTYLPAKSERQEVLKLDVAAPNMVQNDFNSNHGLVSRWQGNYLASTIAVNALVQGQKIQYEIPSDLKINTAVASSSLPYLGATEAIQVHAPEIAKLWQDIKPDEEQNLLAVVDSIYQYTSSLQPLAFKGGTDALTAFRLGAASCNGKSRLFTALARLNNIPTRLVGGVILKDGKKKTSHQWVEILVNNHWVPFDPTNNHFASLPENYLELYRGDLSLFSHSKNIAFDYRFTIEQKTIAQSLITDGLSGAELNWLQQLKAQLGISDQAFAIFLLMPMCALIITILRNVIGLKSFGVFMPMLIASACTLIGLTVGLIGFLSILGLAVTAYLIMGPLKLLKIPRLAILITLINILTVAILVNFKDTLTFEAGLLSLFPVIVISFVADKMHDLIILRDWKNLFSTTLGTAISIFMCFWILKSSVLQNLFMLHFEFYALVLLAQVYFGRWTGARLFELLRFRHVSKFSEDIIGINKRNKVLVNELNSPALLKLAADKLESKKVLQQFNVPVPGTLATFESLTDLKNLPRALANLQQFVVKPNAGSQGNGILVIKSTKGKTFTSASGKSVNFFDVYGLVHEIINGHYSQLGDADIAYLEPVIEQHSALNRHAPNGLCDIRVVLLDGKVVNAMLRIPTKKSGGKANLHQGAIGAALNIDNGQVTEARQFNKAIELHPDSDALLTEICLPYWHEILSLSERCYQAIPLGYMGVDICLDAEKGPLVLEVNGRPGLEIQNITKRGLMAAREDFTPAPSLSLQF